MSKNNRKKVYKNRQNARKNSAFGRFMLSIIILGVVVLIFINVALPVIKDRAKDAVAEKAVDVITENVNKLAGDNVDVQKITESMSDEDKAAVKEIVEEHMDTDTVTEIMSYVNKGDKDGLINYAAENLSPEEISSLMEIYGKYAD